MADQEGKVELVQNLAWDDCWVAWLRVGGVGIESTGFGAIRSPIHWYTSHAIASTVRVCL